MPQGLLFIVLVVPSFHSVDFALEPHLGREFFGQTCLRASGKPKFLHSQRADARASLAPKTSAK